MDVKELRWYAFKAISGKEKNVKEYIELNMKNRGYQHLVPQVLIPTKKVETIVRGKRVIKELNMLPGYVLIEACLVGEILHLLRYTPGVLGVLGGMDNPTALRQSELNRMLGIGVEDETPVVVQTDFVQGDAVKVTDGPFEGFDATVEEVFQDKQKLKVAVRIFGRVTPLELTFAQVIKE